VVELHCNDVPVTEPLLNGYISARRCSFCDHGLDSDNECPNGCHLGNL
jgi:hypothetical protein